MTLFRKLNEQETVEFRAWARSNYIPLDPIDRAWHPVVQDECAAINREYNEDRKDLDVDFDATLAALDALEEARSTDPDVQRARLRVLGAPAHLAHDLSDADALWVSHDCISDETGACPVCTAYVASGGVL